MPGGSEHLMDLMLVAVSKAGGNVDDQKLFEMVNKVYESEVAKKNRLMPGVHIDDEHGHLEMRACEDRVSGCGYDKVRRQVLERIGVEVEYNPGDRIGGARDWGWRVQVLTGDHFAHSTAAINYLKGMTLKTQSLLAEDRNPSFNYDIWVLSELVPVMVDVLKDEGLEKASELLEESALDWGKQIYAETLDILSGGALGDKDLIVIEA